MASSLDNDLQDDCCEFKGERGKRITILSVDGGGVRGVIPAVVLQCLERQLQELDGVDARVANYFDVISGTSTGGLIAAMLACPDQSNWPLYTAEDIVSLYMNQGHLVFPPRRPCPLSSTTQVFKMLNGPKYTSSNLESLLMDKLQDRRMSETVTELLIPTYDIKLMQPAFFSTSEAKENESKNAYIRHVCRGTSAAPTYLAPCFFQTTDSTGKTRDFNLVDGAMAANNPAYLSIVHVLKELHKGNERFCGRMEDKDYKSLLVLSLGTGTQTKSYDAVDASHWGALSWIMKDGDVPILDLCLEGSADMVDFNLSVVFQTIQCRDNYLRIQASGLSKDVSSMDNASPGNMQRLCEVATSLLEKKVTMVDVDTGKYIPQPHRGTNRQALVSLASELVKERVARKGSRDDHP